MRILALVPAVLAVFLSSVAFAPLAAQVVVSPTGVNVASQGPTTVFLTFGGLGPDLVPVEALWCGELVSAAPDVGERCDPATLFGRLPLRFEQARASGTGGLSLTDVMTVPASVARRAWQAAAAGRPAAFFYVRRFASRSGGRSVYVAVTCRLTSGGATSPLSLVDVRVAFDGDAPSLALEAGAPAPPWHAEISYTGTGRLQGRWEVVRPGEELPTEEDLLTEATLPLEQRGTQARWMALDRFNVFLPPTGRVRLAGPDPSRLPRQVDGMYLLLLRVEASDDRDSQSDLAAAGAGTGPVTGGAVAGFPMPTLRYFVGSGGAAMEVAPPSAVRLLLPAEGAALDSLTRLFTWQPMPGAAQYRLELARADGTVVFEAVVPASTGAYRPPPFLAERAGAGPLRWRVHALGADGRGVARSAWRTIGAP